MSSSKLRKISRIVKEISIQNSQSRYDISGLDLSLCKFYYRTSQQLFKDLPSGDYTIDTSSNQQFLVVQNSAVISSGEAIQVCYEMDLSSSKYEVDFEVDINRLTTSYNELVDDVHTLWEYIRKTGMIADDTTIDLILPQLNNNEVWVKSEDGYRGVPLDSVESSIKDIIDKYSQQKIEEIKREITTHADSEIQRATNEITDVKDTSIQNIKDQEKTSTNNMIGEINKHTEKKKIELNDHEQLKEQELNDLHEQLSTRLQELIDGAVMDKGVLPINSDWHLLDRGNYYVIDLFNSNYKNHPINIVNQNEGQGIVMVGIADDGKTKIIRYYSTSKRMFFQVLTQSNVWSEWAIVGGGSGSVYEIVQNNHGFNFNAVSLDGLTSRWILADKNTGADAVAIKIDDNRFQLLLNGQGVIPTSSRDDKGNEFIYDEYYFLSNTVNGAFKKDKPTYGLFQPLFHTRMVENKLVADVQIGDIHDLTQHIVDSETIKEYGIATEKDLLNKLDKGNVSADYNSAEKMEGKIKEVADSLGSISLDWDSIAGKPSALPNPYALTIKLNGTVQTEYNGNLAKELDITAEKIGALSTNGGTVYGGIFFGASGNIRASSVDSAELTNEGDGANVMITSWWGVGFSSPNTGNGTNVVIDARVGDIKAKGSIQAAKVYNPVWG